MKVVYFAAAMVGLVVADDHCESLTTCLDCQEDGCGWYQDAAETGMLMRCYNSTMVDDNAAYSQALKIMDACPECQAGSCPKCQEQSGCNWFANVAHATCAKGDTKQSYTKQDVCPTCDTNVQTDCKSCSAVPGCNWYEILGRTNGECAEEAPIGKTIVPAAACDNKDICAGAANCAECKEKGNSTCSWYTVPDTLVAVTSDKCDLADLTGLQSPFYTEVEGECPKCASNDCVGCNAEAGCKWYDYKGIGGTCRDGTEDPPFGADEVAADRCWGVCELFSCSECNAKDECSWYVPKYDIGKDPVCSFTENTPLIGADELYDKPTTCEACDATRCYECWGLTGCQWAQQKYTGFLGNCISTEENPGMTEEIIAEDSRQCDGSPTASGASKAVVSGAVAAILAVALA